MGSDKKTKKSSKKTDEKKRKRSSEDEVGGASVEQAPAPDLSFLLGSGSKTSNEDLASLFDTEKVLFFSSKGFFLIAAL